VSDAGAVDVDAFDEYGALRAVAEEGAEDGRGE